jgi:transaldolase
LNEGKPGEELFFELALEDLMKAADQFRPIHEQTNGVDGWVSPEVSPLLAHDTAGHPRGGEGSSLSCGAGEPLHLFIKIPGTKPESIENWQIPLASSGLGLP